jgi:amino acid adenylation domain-containing protein
MCLCPVFKYFAGVAVLPLLKGTSIVSHETTSTIDSRGGAEIGLKIPSSVAGPARPSLGTVVHEFRARVAERGDAPAVIDGDVRLTYQELDERSDHLARCLAACEVAADSRVALLLDRGVDAVTAFVGVVKAGAAYLPLDPRYPAARMEMMITACDVGMVLVDTAERAELVRGFFGNDDRILSVAAAVRRGRGERAVPRGVHHPGQLACVLYTSGSTGTPKGAGLTHGNIVGLAKDTLVRSAGDEDWPDGKTDRVLLHSSLAFDASNLEIWAPLLRGGCVVVAPPGDVDGSVVRRMVSDAGVSTVVMTTALFNAIAQDAPDAFAGLRHVLIGGEAASPAAMSRVIAASAPGALVNGYGPTETTTFATRYVVRSAGSGPVPLGGPIDGLRLYVVDECGELAGNGVAGELYLGGTGVSRGYVGRPAMTAERFVPDPYGPPGTRMYRTGDFCRWRPDGLLEFVGRQDGQVKIRGFRVELGEIESVLSRRPEIFLVTVVAREDRADTKTLAAYVVPAAGHSVDPAALRDYLLERLPDYMVPSAIVALDTLPLTTNGKVDVRALPAPVPETGDREPESAAERVLARLFAKILGLDTVGADDDFFDLGGNSLLAVRLVGRLRSKYGVELRVKDLVRTPSVAGLAAGLNTAQRRRLTGDGAGPPAGVPAIAATTSPSIPVPLSFAQQRLWFLDQLWPGRPDYNVPCAVRLTGPLDVGALAEAFGALAERHDILRTRYEVRDDEPYQIVEPARMWSLRVADHSAQPAEHAVRLADGTIHQEWARPFDLSAAPPVRILLIKVAEEHHILSMVIHHIATDGWSNQVLLSDLAALYGSATGDPGAPGLPRLNVRYADYGEWQREQLRTARLHGELEYWRRRLAGLKPVELPTDRPRPAERSGRGAQLDFAASAKLRRKLLDLGKVNGTTLFMTLLTAFQVMVAKHTGQRDIAIGTPVAGRGQPDLEQMAGFFVNTLVLRGDIDPRRSFTELLARTRAEAADAYSHSELPFEQLVGELQPERDLGRNPLFQLMFTMADTGGTAAPPRRWGDLDVRAHPVPFQAAKFDLEIAITDREERLTGSAYYASDLFDESTVDQILKRYLGLLESLVGQPDRPVAEIRGTSEDDERRLADWNDTAAQFPLDQCLHELVAQQAERTPDAVAVAGGGRRLSYADLDRLSNQLAHLLVARGLRRGEPAGVWMERGVDLMVALLGVLKAGGAFVPLDPDLPIARARQLLTESGATLCLTGDPPSGHLSCEAAIRAVAVDSTALAAWPAEPPEVTVDPDDLVSIYYTSGSTGTPKGVANPHRGWVNRMWWMQDQHGLAAGEGVLHKTVLSFDDSAVELFWPLMVGGRVVMLEPGLHRDPRAILRAAIEHEIAVLQFVPSVLGLFLDEITDEAARQLGGLRHVISSGEALRPTLVRHFYERLGAVGCRLHNQWGPTEASVDATLHTCVVEDADAGSVPIGRPLSNYHVHVLDDQLLPLPTGVEGELYIGGVGLARGYWNDPVKTADAFVPDPFRYGERLYRTGDRGVRAADGEVIYRGRTDHQVKIRGTRIELGEIECTLAAHPDVADVVVETWEPEPGDRQLIAYFVPKTQAALEPEGLREFAAERLPLNLVPTHSTILDKLPLTRSGKVDRKGLPLPEREPETAEWPGTRLPSTESELLVTEVWKEFLHVGDVNDNFFSLGGHSLLATKIISRLRKVLDAELPLVLLFENPTIAGLAAAIERELLGDGDIGGTESTPGSRARDGWPR